MTKYVLVNITIEKQNEEPDASRVGFTAPVGVEVAQAGAPGGNLQCLAVVKPSAPVAWHPLVLMPLNTPIELLLGRKLGKLLGIVPGPNGPCAIYQELPWPQPGELSDLTIKGTG